MQTEATPASTYRGRLDFGLAGRSVVLVGMAMSSYGLHGIMPVMTSIAAAFPDEPNAAMLTRLMITMGGIFVGIMSPIVGGIADRVGQRRMLLGALLLYAVAGCAPFFLNNIYAILVTRIFHGIAVATYGTLVLVMLVNHSTGNARDRWLGYLVMFATMFSILSGPMVGYLGHDFGWRSVFLTYAVALPVFALALVGFPPDAPSAHKAASTGPSVADDFTVMDQVKFAAFALLCGGTVMASPMFIPFRLREIGIVDTRVIGNVMMATSIASIVAGYVFGRVRAYMSATTTFIVAFSIITVGLVLIGLVNDMYSMIAAMFVTGLGQGLAIPNYWSFSAASAPERYRARIMGFAKSGVYGGPLIIQFVVEPVISRANYAAGFGALAVISVGFAVYFALRLTRERGARANQVPA